MAVCQAAALAAPVYVQPKVEVEVEMPVVEVPVEMIEEHQHQVDPITIIDTTYHPPFEEEEVVVISRFIIIVLVDEKVKPCELVNEQAKP